jgi:transcriptional regulator with XRE-family HTH domain
MKGATSIQERLWELRKDKGLNLEELSKLTGISKSALGSYEKEDFKEINHGNLITLADFYGVSVDYLLCRTENREQINTPLTELHLNDEMVALLKRTLSSFLRTLRFMWMGLPPCRFKTSTPLSILSDMKS